MLRWRFSTYVTETGKAVVQLDIDRFDDYGLAQFEARVRYLAATTNVSDWHEPHAKKLKGLSLHEIRFKNARKETRALGFFGPDPDEFTITAIATHKQNVYTPACALDSAASRCKAVREDPTRRQPLTVDDEVFPPVDDGDEATWGDEEGPDASSVDGKIVP